jgi:hypothetical protein
VRPEQCELGDDDLVAYAEAIQGSVLFELYEGGVIVMIEERTHEFSLLPPHDALRVVARENGAIWLHDPSTGEKRRVKRRP